ncbi:MAG: helix-turn-helix domain-containing protein [Phaeodactylibacter sp.]|uniref:helix-turn-helix domain-containing protein n=1 Tax=Phaeodactylibacter sp. TaxID=1940289 RepID=UPI0032EC1B91
MPFSLLDLIIFISLAQGLVFGGILLSAPQFKGTDSRYLAYTIIMVSVIGLNEWLSSWGFDDQYYFIDFFGDDVPWMLLFYVPIVWYFLKATGHTGRHIRALSILLVLPFAVFLFLNILIDLDVDFGLYYSTAVLVALWAVMEFLPVGQADALGHWDYALWGGVSCFIYWLLYQGLVRSRLEEVPAEGLENVVESGAQTEEASSDGVSKTAETYQAALQVLFEEEQLYRDPDLSRDKVAAALGISPGYLSQVIREVSGSSFTTYVNALRIAAVKQMLEDEAYTSYSLLAIGEEAGFRSKSAFYTTFKKHTGMTPSAYQKSAHSSTSDN